MSKSTEEIIASLPPDEDTFEYWIVQARDGRNIAECWQNCYRIADNTPLLSYLRDKKKELEQSHFYKEYGLFGDKEKSGVYYFLSETLEKFDNK